MGQSLRLNRCGLAKCSAGVLGRWMDLVTVVGISLYIDVLVPPGRIGVRRMEQELESIGIRFTVVATTFSFRLVLMSSRGCDQPKPYLSGQNKGKRVMKRKRPRYVLKVSRLSLPLHLFHVLRLQTYLFNQEETILPPHLPQPRCGINAFSIVYRTLNIIGTITIAKGYTIINTLTAIGAF
ncbi:hypothetical protein ACSQ67_025200 [Phaseolus vulgaris]